MEVIELSLNEAAVKNIGLMKLSLGKSFFPNLEAIFYSIFRFTTSRRVAVTLSTFNNNFFYSDNVVWLWNTSMRKEYHPGQRLVIIFLHFQVSFTKYYEYNCSVY